MKIIIDTRKIRQRSLLSNVMSIGGLLTLLASVVLPLFAPGMASLSLILMVAGLGISMVGIYFANRWVRKPRPEDQLNIALKSLNDSFHIYHYPSLPSDHVLLTPSSIFILETVGLSGVFAYRNGKWKESMTMGRAVRWIVEEHLGDPFRAARATERYLQDQLGKMDTSRGKVEIKSLVVFTHPAVDLEVENAPIPVVKVDKLRKMIPSNSLRMDAEIYRRLDDFLGNRTNSG